MSARRLDRPGRELVTLRVDGDDVSAVRGEPVAMSLLAAGRLVLGRSVKYHRPRGAACFSGRCDGCLMRVDGVPSVRTCRLPAAQDLELETQNVLGSAEIDLLSAADWFFPGGMNHHEMFTWAKPVNHVMQLVAREVAGIGTLPSEVRAPSPVTDRAPDVLVIGAGFAGLAAARTLAKAGLDVLVVDEEEAVGGSWLDAVRASAVSALARDAESAGADVRVSHAAVGIFDEPHDVRLALIASHAGIVRVRARAWVLAVGRHEGSAAFEGADLPGVIGAEAAARVLARGIVPGERVVIAGDLDSRGAELDALARALSSAGAKVEGPHALDRVARADGRNQVSSVTLTEGSKRSKHACDLLVVGPRTSASYELAVQAGARTTLRNGCFELVHAGGAHATWIVGSAGDPALATADAGAVIADAERAAAEIIATLGAGPEATR